MRKRVFISIFLTSLLTMILTFILISWIMYNNTFDSVKREVQNESFYVSDWEQANFVQYSKLCYPPQCPVYLPE
jgi:ABC-type phosphate transport system permease subunit